MKNTALSILATVGFGVLATAAYAQDVTLRLGHANSANADSVYQIAAESFKEAVEEASGGEIGVQIFPSRQLGGDADMIEFVKEGTLDIQITSLNLVSNHAPRLDALFLPYMFPERSDAIRVTESLLGELTDYTVKRGNFRVMDLMHIGYRKLMTTQPIMNMAEIRDIKFRLPPSPVMVKTFAAYGVESTPIPWGELFSAMQLGVVDGFEVDLTPLVSARFNEVVTDVTDVDWVSQISAAVMSQQTYARLTEDQQAAVDAASAVMRQHVIETMESLEADIIAASEKVTFHGRPNDYDQWIELGRGVWPEFYERIGDGDAAAGEAFVTRVSDAVAGD